jgi:hypothetical protein
MSDSTEQTELTSAGEGSAPAKAAPKKKSAAGALTFKVSAKGAVSVYGLGRFPVTLYHEQWRRLLGNIPALEQFLEDNKAQLKSKDAAGPAAAGEETGGGSAPEEVTPTASDDGPPAEE